MNKPHTAVMHINVHTQVLKEKWNFNVASGKTDEINFRKSNTIHQISLSDLPVKLMFSMKAFDRQTSN